MRLLERLMPEQAFDKKLPQMFLLLVNLAATLFMTGVIWFVQVVHYPLFARVGATSFPQYEVLHSQATSAVVAVPMLIELFTGAALCVQKPDKIDAWLLWLGLAMLGAIWVSTMFVQVPKHNLLAGGFNAEVHHSLVSTNWVRTVLWSARSLLLLWALWKALE